MATIVPYTEWVSPGVAQTTWAGITGTGSVVGSYTAGGRLTDRTVYAEGTFASGVVTLQATYTTTASGYYVGCVDPNGNAISFSASGGHEQVLENAPIFRPRVSGTTGGTSVNVVLIEHGTR